MPENASSFFDTLIAGDTKPEPPPDAAPPLTTSQAAADTPNSTPLQIKETTQELLRTGVLEAQRKPNLYRIASTQQTAIQRTLEPLDLNLRVDDIRGLAYLTVTPSGTSSADGETDEWAHPLVRRQRLTLEQSLLVALLRQHYMLHEQEAGVGAGEARVALEDLLPHLQLYLGELGSDSREQQRLRQLLEKLKPHGIVSDIDSQDQISIRPIIVHLANPENLVALLETFRQAADPAARLSEDEAGLGPDSSTSGDEGEEGR